MKFDVKNAMELIYLHRVEFFSDKERTSLVLQYYDRSSINSSALCLIVSVVFLFAFSHLGHWSLKIICCHVELVLCKSDRIINFLKIHSICAL